MSSVILADRDPLYAWFVTEALLAAGVPVTWFRSATAAVTLAAAGADGEGLLLMDADTWLAEAAPPDHPGPPSGSRAVLLGWPFDQRPPAGFAVERDKPGDAGALRRLVAVADDRRVAPAETFPGGAG
jgi:hypothetical protein